MVSSKMRPSLVSSAFDHHLGASSTGSSRRSSPLSNMAFSSNCSSAQSTSPPNSPAMILSCNTSTIMPTQQQSTSATQQHLVAPSCHPTTSSNSANGTHLYAKQLAQPALSPASSHGGSVASMSTRQSRWVSIAFFKKSVI